MFSEGPSLSTPRAAHVATRVGDIVVLVGGTEDEAALPSTEILRGAAWRSGPRLGTPRVKHAVAPLDHRRVLVVGGATATDSNERLATTEVLDVVGGSARPGPRLSQGEYKLDGAVAVLDDGRVVMPSGPGLAVFDPDDRAGSSRCPCRRTTPGRSDDDLAGGQPGAGRGRVRRRDRPH